MKYLLTFALMGLLGIANISYSQEIPKGLKEIMDQLQTDPKAAYGFNFAKELRFINPDLEFKDWFVGLPIEFFKLNGEALENADENSAISTLIVPTGIWYVPVRINKKYIYYIEVFGENSKFKSIGCGDKVLGFHYWDKVREKYPEESGIRPIVIGLVGDKFIYFPDKKDGKSLFHVRNPKWNDELSKITSKSLDELDDNAKIIRYWKDDWEKNKENRRKFLEKNPDLFKDNSGGKK